MPVSVEQLYKETLLLPDESKAFLAERIVEYLETHIDPELERMHLDTAKRRRDDIRAGRVKPIDGDAALAKARKLAKK